VEAFAETTDAGCQQRDGNGGHGDAEAPPRAADVVLHDDDRVQHHDRHPEGRERRQKAGRERQPARFAEAGGRGEQQRRPEADALEEAGCPSLLLLLKR